MRIITHSLFVYSDPPTILSRSFLLTQAIFGPDILPYIYSKILNPTYSSYISAFEDGTDWVFRNVGI